MAISLSRRSKAAQRMPRRGREPGHRRREREEQGSEQQGRQVKSRRCLAVPRGPGGHEIDEGTGRDPAKPSSAAREQNRGTTEPAAAPAKREKGAPPGSARSAATYGAREKHKSAGQGAGWTPPATGMPRSRPPPLQRDAGFSAGSDRGRRRRRAGSEPASLTSGKCGSSGRPGDNPLARAAGEILSGRVIRVVEIVWSAGGSPGAFGRAGNRPAIPRR